MRKIFTLLCGVLFAAQFTTVSAQTTNKMTVYKTDGSVVEYTTSEVDSVTFYTQEEDPKDGKIINGHKFVDLGLPSGLLWAETNIGAETATDNGYYFAWGETKTKDTYTTDNYTYNENPTTLDAEHDAATQNWGSSCRMPTKAEFEELTNSDNCTWTWTSLTTTSGSTINGYIVISVKNGNSIFFPASGFYHNNNLGNEGKNAFFWSSSLYQEDTKNAYCLDLGDAHNYSNKYGRFYGFTVRPVAKP